MKELSLKAVNAMRAEGWKWVEIQRHFGVSYFVIRSLDEAWRLATATRIRESRSGVYVARVRNPKAAEPIKSRPTSADLAARLAEIPMDTRDLTGQLMGDPLPGRSALDAARAISGDKRDG